LPGSPARPCEAGAEPRGGLVLSTWRPRAVEITQTLPSSPLRLPPSPPLPPAPPRSPLIAVRALPIPLSGLYCVAQFPSKNSGPPGNPGRFSRSRPCAGSHARRRGGGGGSERITPYVHGRGHAGRLPPRTVGAAGAASESGGHPFAATFQARFSRLRFHSSRCGPPCLVSPAYSRLVSPVSLRSLALPQLLRGVCGHPICGCLTQARF